MTRTAPSGTQHILRFGDDEACVTGVGASLRYLRHQGRDLVVPFETDEIRPAYRGVTLAPWPNRVVDGRYRLDGVAVDVPINEHARGHALHGLLSWTEYTTVDAGEDHVTLETVIVSQPAYPWRVRVRTTFELAEAGLTQTVLATNESELVAPWGTGPHPYLLGGSGALDTWALHLPADEVLTVTDDRLVPIGLEPVDASDARRFDFRVPRPIGDARIDHAYTGLRRDALGAVAVRVLDDTGIGTQISWGAECGWVQIHTADTDDPATDRLGLAVEPMTCAPDAFNDDRYEFDTGLLLIAPGDTATASWTIAPVG